MKKTPQSDNDRRSIFFGHKIESCVVILMEEESSWTVDTRAEYFDVVFLDGVYLFVL